MKVPLSLRNEWQRLQLLRDSVYRLENYHVYWLEEMSCVRWKSERGNLTAVAELNKLHCAVQTVAVKKESMRHNSLRAEYRSK